MPEPRRPPHILFLCVANSARSQLAEGLARHLFGEAVQVQSAGSAPGGVHPLAIQVLEEVGVDTSQLTSKHVESISAGEGDGGDGSATRGFDLVITLCAEEVCPAYLGPAERRSWAMPDPAGPADAPLEEQLLTFRSARDHIHARLLTLGRELHLSGVGDRNAAVDSPRPGAPVVAVVGWKNSGKTTLVERLVAELSGRGLRVGTVKATHHDVEPDPVGKDSWRHRRAGAVETLLIGPGRWVLTHEGATPCHAALARLTAVDLIVVEGLRGARLPKVEVVAPGSTRPLLAGQDPDVVLVAADGSVGPLDVPVLPRDDIAGIADAVLAIAQSDPAAGPVVGRLGRRC